jgi:hypothetical protein
MGARWRLDILACRKELIPTKWLVWGGAGTAL